MEIRVSLEKGDIKALYRQIRVRAKIENSRPVIGLLKTIFLWVILTILFLSIFRYYEDELMVFHLPTALIMIVVVSIAYIYYLYIYSKLLAPSVGGFLYGERSLIFTTQGIEEQARYIKQNIAWGAVQDISETQSHLFIFYDSIVANIIPKRIFNSEQSIVEFVKNVRELHATAVGGQT